jgi:hypothetical protein
MTGFVPVAALLFMAGTVDVDGAVVAELRAGSAPLTVGVAPTLSLVEVVTPGASLRLSPDHLTVLRFDYGVRIFWRQAEGASTSAPLVLHTASFNLRGRPTHRATLSGGANASYGAVDYTYLPRIFDMAQSMAPQMSQATLPQVSNFLSVAGGTSAQVQASHLWTLDSGLNASHHRPVGDQTSALSFPTQTALSANSAAAAHVSPNDDAVVAAGGTYQTISSTGMFSNGQVVPTSGRFRLLSVSSQLGWRAKLSPREELQLAGGLIYNHVYESPTAQRPQPIAPKASVEYVLNELTRRAYALRFVAGGSVDYYLDPVLGTTGPRGVFNTGVAVAFPPEWTVGLDVSFATSLSLTPLPGEETFNGTPHPDETTFNLSLPARHRLSRESLLEFGFRWSDRGPRLADRYFYFHQRQLWLYVAVSLTSTPIPRWFAP